MESQIAPSERKLPRDIAAKPKAYAFERSLGIPMAQACRTAGGKVEHGQATKWERSPRVQAWISYYRSLGQTDEMLAAKRQRVEDELWLVGQANMDDFVTLVPHGATMIPVLDMTRINALPEVQRRQALAAVKTVKYTENGPTFELHGKLDALSQIRDMHGMAAPKKLGIGNQKDGGPIEMTLAALPAAEQDRLLAAIDAELGARKADQSAA